MEQTVYITFTDTINAAIHWSQWSFRINACFLFFWTNQIPWLSLTISGHIPWHFHEGHSMALSQWSYSITFSWSTNQRSSQNSSPPQISGQIFGFLVFKWKIFCVMNTSLGNEFGVFIMVWENITYLFVSIAQMIFPISCSINPWLYNIPGVLQTWRGI